MRGFFRARGHEVQVIFGSGTKPFDPSFGDALVLEGVFASWRERMRAYVRLVESCQPDVVYTFSGHDEFDLFRFLRCARVRHVFSLESQPFMDIPYALHTYQDYIEMLTANTPDAVEETARHTQCPCLLAPYRMIYPDEGRQDGIISPVPPELPIQVAYVSRLEYLQKRAHWLPEIIHRCREAGANLQWHIYGDGPEAPLLHRKLAGAGDVVLHGWTSRDILYQRLPTHQIFFLCSRWEGLPVAMLEAMLRGLACVVPDIPAGIRWIIGQGGGWLYNADSPRAAADALVAATRDRTLIAKKQNEALGLSTRLFPPGQAEDYFHKLETAFQKLTWNGRALDPATAPPFRPVRWPAYLERVPVAWHKLKQSPVQFLKRAAAT